MLRFLRTRERGQILVIGALLLPALLGMTGMAIDVGRYASDRRSLQNAADAVALAAAQKLCTPSCTSYTAAEAAGQAILAKYAVNPADVTITPGGGGTAPQVSVQINRSHNFVFMRILGVNSKSVGARAVAAKVSWGGGSGVVPWAVTDAVVSNAGSGDLVTMKYDASNPTNGNFGPIRIDGSGNADYEDDVSYGSDTHICADSTPNCDVADCSPGSFPEACAEDAPQCSGPECPTETGNKVAGTRDGVDFRMNNTSASCDTFDEAFSTTSSYADPAFPIEEQLAQAWEANGGGRLSSPPQAPAGPPPATATPVPTSTPAAPNATPTVGGPTATYTPGSGSTQRYRLNNACNPWIDGPGACPDDNVGTLCSRRVIIIPVIDSFGPGALDVTVLRFALMFLEGYDASKCTGNACEIQGRFVYADFTSNALAGVYDPSASVHFAKLIE